MYVDLRIMYIYDMEIFYYDVINRKISYLVNEYVLAEWIYKWNVYCVVMSIYE